MHFPDFTNTGNLGRENFTNNKSDKHFKFQATSINKQHCNLGKLFFYLCLCHKISLVLLPGSVFLTLALALALVFCLWLGSWLHWFCLFTPLGVHISDCFQHVFTPHVFTPHVFTLWPLCDMKPHSLKLCGWSSRTCWPCHK